MKNNALKLISLAVLMPMMTACPNSGKKETGPIWNNEIDAEMIQYLGEVLPFVQLNEETMYHSYSSDYEADYGIGVYFIGDDNENNVVADYGAKLEEAGWTFTDDEEGGYYSKEVNEFELICTFDWYEASETYEAGNEISVQCPIYVAPVTEESLIAAGYEKVTGWPAEDVLEVLTDAYNISPISQSAEWFTSGVQLIEGLFGDYYGIFLAIHSDVTEEANTAILGSGYYYDDEYQAYYSTDDEAMVAVGLDNGFTLFEIYGPYLQPEQGEVASETEKQDGSIDVAFTFAGNLLDGTSYEETYESTSASLTTAKGSNQNNAPTYYDSGSSLRFYYKNTLTITAASGLTINSVTIQVGFVKNLSADAFAATSGSITATGTAAPATITISGVNAASLTITVGPNASKGNIGIASVTVNVSSAR